MPEEQPLADSPAPSPDTGRLIQTGSNNAAADPMRIETRLEPLPEPRITRKPKGIYRALLPSKGGLVEQVIEFLPNGSFHLEERYPEKGDSLVQADGLWAVSDGEVLLYRNEVLRGRYAWVGDTLNYVLAGGKQKQPMSAHINAETTSAWQTRKAEGLKLFGIGNEPFWSVSLTGKDSLIFQLADWPKPLTLALDSATTKNGAQIYLATQDSLQLRVQVDPHFCSDGMSDYYYRRQVRVQYKGQTYSGCGTIFER